MRLGIEVGGTFTDLIAIDGEQIRITKVPSTPSTPHAGALNAIETAGIDLSGVTDLVHGSTVATNAILERKGARVAFLVTSGFRDLLLLQRHNRREIYDLAYRKPAAVVDRSQVFEIKERVDSAGEVVIGLDESTLTEQLRHLFAEGAFESVAICFLNSYAFPAHERRVAGIIAQLMPRLPITCSCDVTREFREYERASTTTLSAYVRPVIERYLRSFETELGSRGFEGRFSIMQSSGGRLPAAGMSDNAITSLFSGPAAGVIGAVRQAKLSGFENLITLDMGGTSTDVCMVMEGKPALSTETQIDGLPIRTPVLDIVTVGAGGGSIIWRDDGGMLRVGPESAGAEPGPACYARGGTRPTITDAHMIRGSLRAEAFLGGRMAIECKLAEQSLGDLAHEFGNHEQALADAAIRVADNNIVRAIQLVSTERGHDPRDCVLVPFGGAGPLHAARIAEELSIDTLCIPPAAGVLSAYGLLASDFVRYSSLTRRLRLGPGTADEVRSIFDHMKAESISSFADLGIAEGLRFHHVLEMRYVGQAFEVSVEFGAEQLMGLDDDTLGQRFDAAHQRIFEFAESNAKRVEIVSFRLGVRAPPDALPSLRASESHRAPGRTRLFDRGVQLECELLGRLHVSHTPRPGPVLIEDETSTIYVPRGWSVHLDPNQNLIVQWEAAAHAH